MFDGPTLCVGEFEYYLVGSVVFPCRKGLCFWTVTVPFISLGWLVHCRPRPRARLASRPETYGDLAEGLQHTQPDRLTAAELVSTHRDDRPGLVSCLRPYGLFRYWTSTEPSIPPWMVHW